MRLKQLLNFLTGCLILKTKNFWLEIVLRIKRIENGVFGDCKVINKDISELRFFFGGGFRVYYTVTNNEVIFLLQGGIKDTQNKDIKKAQQLFDELQLE